MYDSESIARIQAQAFNAHDLQSFANQYAAGARVLKEGHLVGEGRPAVCKILESEFHPGGYVQVHHLDGEPVLAECHGDPEHPDLDGVIRLHHVGEFVDEVRIDHDPELLARLQA